MNPDHELNRIRRPCGAVTHRDSVGLVKLEPLTFDLSDAAKRDAAIAEWINKMRRAVRQTVAAWAESSEGDRWAYRRAVIRPSYFKSEQAWNNFLDEQRKSKPVVEDLAPALNGLSLLIQLDPDLRDATRQNLRVMLENNSAEVSSRLRHRYEHTIHQVSLEVSLPAGVHRPLKLDRVEPSYRFRDFLSYPAIGINCGVMEVAAGDRVRLATSWMPRYYQPRIVQSDINGVETEFAELAKDTFDPVDLLGISTAYRNWIANEKATLDPGHGADTDEERDREREKLGFYVRLNEARVIAWLQANGIGQNLPPRDGMRLGGILVEDYADFGRFMESYRERTADSRTQRSVPSYVYLLLHTMAHHFAHAVIEFSGLDHGSTGEYVFPADLSFLVYRKGMTPDLGNLSAMWRNHGLTVLDRLLWDRALKCDGGSLCDQRGGACPACIMAPDVACIGGNNLLSRAALSGGVPPSWDIDRSALTGYLRLPAT